MFSRNMILPVVLGAFAATPGLAADLGVTSDTTLTGPATYDNVLVTGTAILTVSGGLTVLNDMTVKSGGVVTHAGYPVNAGAGLVLNVMGTLRVESGGVVGAVGRGLRGGMNGSSFGTVGETWDGSGTAVVAGATGRAGASYGGMGGVGSEGGTPNGAYGVAENPRQFGSGGGGASGDYAGNGGGRITISAGVLALDGTITADGGAGSSGGTSGAGGGSGGALRIDCDSIATGSSGTLSARGGDGVNNGGAGGGGRIAVWSGDLSGLASVTLAAGGGTGTVGGFYTMPGAAGTIFLRPSRADSLVAGDLIVDNGSIGSSLTTALTPLRTGLTQVRDLTPRARAQVTIASGDIPSLTIGQHLSLSGSAGLRLGSGAEIVVTPGGGFAVNVQSGSALTLEAGSSLAADRVRVNGVLSRLNARIDLGFPSPTDLELSGGATLNVLNGATLSLGVFDARNIQGGTVLDSTGSRLVIATDTVTVASGVTLVKDGAFGVSGDAIGTLAVETGGVVTHSGYPANAGAGLTLNVTTLTVESSGVISAVGRGLRGGRNGSSFGAVGETWDAGGAVVAGATGRAGASYGGMGGVGSDGGVANGAYGLAENPREFGSGGGGLSGDYGGNGGGRITISADVLTLYGVITADGGPASSGGTSSAGGGSGGALRIDCDSIATGSNGTLSARGGNGVNNGGAGGGGRIAVWSGDTTGLASVTLAAGGGSGTVVGFHTKPGAAGTILLRPSRTDSLVPGDLIIDNGSLATDAETPFLTSATFHALTLAHDARLVLDAPHSTVDWVDTIDLGGATLSAPGSITLAGATLRGVGTVATPLVNHGTIQPGSSPGVLVCEAGFAQGPSGLLEMELASPTEYDHLHVIGTASLDGTCALTYLDGFNPLPQQRFDLVSYTTHTGEFAEIAGIDTTRFTFVYADTTAALDADSTYVSDIQPNHGGSNGAVTVNIFGLGFQTGSTPVLCRAGEADIPGTLTFVQPDGQSLTTTFDLLGQTEGLWNVVVSSPGYADTLGTGFLIEPPDPLQVRVDVVGPSQMRPNRPTPFHVILKNMGNTDLVNVPLWISRLPAGAMVDLDFALGTPHRAPGEPDWSGVPSLLDGPGGRYLALVIPRIKPGATIRRFRITVPNTVTTFDLDAALTPPWADGQVFRACLNGGGVIGAPACMGAQLTAINDSLQATAGIDALNGVGVWAKVAWQCEGVADSAAALVKAEEVLDYLLQPVEGTLVPSGCEVALRPWWQTRRKVTVVTSVDPNDKFGATGVGPDHLIGSDQVLPYVVQFENLAAASAPVQELAVVDPLDLATLDMSTVGLGAVSFGEHVLYPPPGSSGYVTEVDLRPELDLKVRVGVSLDRATGLVSWTMRAIDPATGLVPTDPQAGFLPPDGDGSVLLTVMPKAGLPGGTEVPNGAVIDFDGALMPTPPWSNTLDAGTPTSHVLPLPSPLDSTSFTVRWEADAAYPDLHAYSVYVSEDGGRYWPWRIQTSATADTIVALPGRTYAFYSLAEDSSGNLEPVPPMPDAVTTTPVGAEDAPRTWTLALEGTMANPVVGEARVWFTLPDGAPTALEVIDVTGRRVWRRDVGALGPGRHGLDVRAAVPQPGIYFLRLVAGGRILRTRMVVVR